ncbi:hypothetical protein PR048_029960 [Dryococelus australis]|uniref:Uncharacterized protein n=1 Tax=Dryococelus australis TaxID=614101 RepID=A0ABQ9G7M2_9NEOP|nr:hypothetical protein PR048_029960 [Dryococelus australis]
MTLPWNGGFSRGTPVSRPCIPPLLRFHLTSPPLALNTSLLTTDQNLSIPSTSPSPCTPPLENQDFYTVVPRVCADCCCRPVPLERPTRRNHRRITIWRTGWHRLVCSAADDTIRLEHRLNVKVTWQTLPAPYSICCHTGLYFFIPSLRCTRPTGPLLKDSPDRERERECVSLLPVCGVERAPLLRRDHNLNQRTPTEEGPAQTCRQHLPENNSCIRVRYHVAFFTRPSSLRCVGYNSSPLDHESAGVDTNALIAFVTTSYRLFTTSMPSKWRQEDILLTEYGVDEFRGENMLALMDLKHAEEKTLGEAQRRQSRANAHSHGASTDYSVGGGRAPRKHAKQAASTTFPIYENPRETRGPPLWKASSLATRSPRVLFHYSPYTLANSGSIPDGVASGFSHVRIVMDDVAGRQVFWGISLFPRPFIPALLHTRLAFGLVGSQDLCAKSRPNLFTHLEIQLLLTRTDFSVVERKCIPTTKQ